MFTQTLNAYADKPAGELVGAALELAQEIHRQQDRICSLAAALRCQLEPQGGKESPDYSALCLAELLEELLSDGEQQYRLRDCLQAMESRV